MPTVFINGQFHENPTLSAFDAGLQHGVGLFETMLGGAADPATIAPREAQGHAISGIGAWVMSLDRHIDRLLTSARELGLSARLKPGPLAEAVLRTVERSKLPRARVRLTITGGDLNLLQRARAADSAPPEVTPTILISAQEATVYPDAFFERGVPVTLADLKLNPLDPHAGHKTLNYWARLRELQAAAAKQAAEALVFQVTNHLAGGCVSSALLIKDGIMHVPIARGEEDTASLRSTTGTRIPSPVLPGVTRAWALDWAERRSVAVRRRMITIDDVLAADELILTNSSWGVLPVVRVENEDIGTGPARGSVGEVAHDMIADWNADTDN
jgi:branched-chain amino acid aminotransferase